MERNVLFVLPNNEPCLKALQLSSKLSVLELDITKLSTTPTWLNGVPSLLDRKTEILYEGTHCLQMLQEMSPETVYGLPNTFQTSSTPTNIEDFLNKKEKNPDEHTIDILDDSSDDSDNDVD